jgi:hypothetical protein
MLISLSNTYLDGQKDMRKNALVICCVTCVFGAFGAFFRWLMGLTGFEAGTGLYIPGNVWSRVLVLACLCCAVVLLAMVLNLRRTGETLPGDCARALGGSTVLYRPGSLIIALLMVVGAVLTLLGMRAGAYPVFQLILGVMAILAAVGFALLTASTIRRRDPPLNCFGVTLIIVMLCFWLIVSYRENANSPVVWGYAFEVLAIAASLVAFYYVAGIPFERAQPFKTIFFCHLAAFLCIVTLPDDRPLGAQFMLIATTGMLLFLGWAAVSNLRVPEEAVPAEKSAAPSPDEENIEE